MVLFSAPASVVRDASWSPRCTRSLASASRIESGALTDGRGEHTRFADRVNREAVLSEQRHTRGIAGLCVVSVSALLAKHGKQARRRRLAQHAESGIPTRKTWDPAEVSATLFGIAWPAFVQLAGEPLAALVDTANVGRLGRAALGGMGVATSAQYSIQKLYNDPLLRVTISKVAASDEEQKKRSVSVALALALVLGVSQSIVFGLRADTVIRGLGVAPESEMFQHAVSYLTVRAWGAPVGSLLLALTGIYRGLGNTRTPLLWSFVATAANVVLDPLFIFVWGFGTGGAALATVLAQLIAVVALLRKLNVQPIGMRALIAALGDYLSTAALMVARNFGKVFTFAFITRKAALLGVVPAAAYALTFQIGFATSQVAESLATATQVALAKELHGSGQRRAGLVRFIVNWGLKAGVLVSIALSLATFILQGPLLRSLTTDAGVQAAASAILPIVMVAQVAKASAYPVNGSLMGGLDWTFLTGAMWVVSAASVLVARAWSTSLVGIWAALTVFFGGQCALGILRIRSATGVWRVFRGDSARS